MRVLASVCLYLCVAVASANPICDGSRAQAEKDLRASLLKMYQDSESLIKRLLNTGMSDYDKLCRIPDNPVSSAVLSNLKRIYYPRFSTIHMLYEANIEASNDLDE
jgi:hypothetical protein